LPDCEIGPLHAGCNVRTFRCGVPEIDAWFHSKSHRRHGDYLVRTFTAHLIGNPQPAGFYSLTIGSEEWKSLPRDQRGASDGSHFPAVTIQYFAVHRSLQKQGIGRLLMGHALEQACDVALIAGTFAVKLVAENDGAVTFYEKLGFRTYGDLGGRPLMILPVGSLIEASAE
jgi:ribosomal protein S18 acetylase RimI-like enzyme